MNASHPPGLNDSDIGEALSMIPNGRGTIQIARYYEVNGTKHVVYDVLDGDGKLVTTDRADAMTIDVEYPAGLVKWPVGSSFRLG